jgi:5-formyltetrahydrofolate cyclo-ligase
MNSSALKREKRAMRRRVLAARDAIAPHERRRRSIAATDRALGLPEVAAARTVLLFWSFGSEIDTGPLIERLDRLGIRLALPRIDDGEIEALAYRPGDPLRATSFGAFEPAEGRLLAAGDLDVIAVPGVAFDRAGGRVGYGGGFYDRFLPRTRADAVRVGLCFDVQVLPGDARVPSGHADLPVHVVVTESETVRCRSTS